MLCWGIALGLAAVTLVAFTAALERREHQTDADRSSDPTRPTLVAPRRGGRGRP